MYIHVQCLIQAIIIIIMIFASEHTMFKFNDLKVNSHYDRHTDRQNDNPSALLSPMHKMWQDQ